MYTLSGASATNSPMVAGGGCGWKENVAPPSLPTLAEEAAGGEGDVEAEAEEEGGGGRGGGLSHQQQRPAGFKSGSINPFAVKPAASKPAPPSPASIAAARAVSREADAGDGGGQKKGSIVPQLGPKAPAPMPAPAPTTFGGAGGGKGGGGGKGSGGGSGKGSGGKGKKGAKTDPKARPITGWLTAPKK
jgi:hypothetical protein